MVERNIDLTKAMSNLQPSEHGEKTSNIQSYSGDKSRVQQVIQNADGSVEYRTSGVDKSTDLEAASSNLHMPGRAAPSGGPATGSNAIVSARSPDGFTPQVASELTPSSIVTLGNGMEMSVKSAIQAGYISQRPDGSYVAVGEAAQRPATGLVPKAMAEKLLEQHQQQQEQQPQEKQEGQQEELHPDLQDTPLSDPADEAVLEEIVANTTPGDQISAIHEIAETGELSEQLLNSAASNAGVEPSQLAEQISTVREAMVKQASGVVEKFGVSADAIFEWGNLHDRAALTAAVKRHALQRDPSGYEAVARKFVERLDVINDGEALLNADLGPGIDRVYRDESGQIVLVGADGVSHTWRNAVRNGLVRLGG